MDAELTFWVVAGILALLFVASLPFINNYLEQREADRMFAREETNIDDMKDV